MRGQRYIGKLLAITGILILASVLMLQGLLEFSLWGDETWTIWCSSADLLTTYTRVVNDNNGPLYYLALNLWMRVAGDGEFATRYFSVLLGILNIALVYRLGRTAFGTHGAGVYAALAVAVAGYHITYARETRMYPMLIGQVLLSVLLYIRWLRRPTRRNALGYILATGSIFYNHYYGMLIVPIQWLHFLLFGRRAGIKRWLMLQGVLLLSMAPWVPVFWTQALRRARFVDTSTYPIGIGIAGATMRTSLGNVKTLVTYLTNDQYLAYGLLLAIAVLRPFLTPPGAGRRRITSMTALALSWLALVPGVTFIANLYMPIYNPRYVSYIVGGLAIMIGSALDALPRRAQVAVALAFALLGTVTYTHGMEGPKQFVRQTVIPIVEAYQPGDRVYLRTSQLEYRYYFEHLMPEVSFDNIVITKPDNDYTRIWYICVAGGCEPPEELESGWELADEIWYEGHELARLYVARRRGPD